MSKLPCWERHATRPIPGFFGRLLLTIVCASASLATSTVAAEGKIVGVLHPTADLLTVVAVNRKTSQKAAGTIDSATGKFHVDIKSNGDYDLIVDWKQGRWEGVDFRVPASDYEQEQPLSEEDLATLKTKLKAMNEFEDKVEILALEGNIQHAVVLLNKRREKPFYNSKPGEIVWRLELWRFEKPEETWVKCRDDLFTLYYRKRIPKQEYTSKTLLLDRRLGGLRIDEKTPTCDVGTLRRPDFKPGVNLAKPLTRDERAKSGETKDVNKEPKP